MTDDPYAERHRGPWPLDPERELSCDRCGCDLVRHRDLWHAYTNPYGPFGWTLLCEQCWQTEGEYLTEGVEGISRWP